MNWDGVAGQANRDLAVWRANKKWKLSCFNAYLRKILNAVQFYSAHKYDDGFDHVRF